MAPTPPRTCLKVALAEILEWRSDGRDGARPRALRMHIVAPARRVSSTLRVGLPTHPSGEHGTSGAAVCWVWSFHRPCALAYVAALDAGGVQQLVHAVGVRWSTREKALLCWPEQLTLTCDPDMLADDVDRAGGARFMALAVAAERLRILSTYLSVLGGAYAAIGKQSPAHARRALQLARQQAALARALGDLDLVFMCAIFQVEALTHLGDVATAARALARLRQHTSRHAHRASAWHAAQRRLKDAQRAPSAVETAPVNTMHDT